jgi:hypothetical protein
MHLPVGLARALPGSFFVQTLFCIEIIGPAPRFESASSGF